LGLTLVRGRLVGNGIRRVRIDVAKAPTVMRIDWIAFRCQVRGRAEPVELRLERPGDLERLTMRRVTEIRPKVFFVGPGSRLTLDLSPLTGEPATAADVQLGYAAMPVAPPHGAERLATARWHARSGLRSACSKSLPGVDHVRGR
jgi:hypothetical protein